MSAYQGGLSIIPACAFDDAKLSLSALRMLGLLGTYSNRDRYCWPLQENLAKRLQVSRQAVTKAIAELKALGYLTIDYFPTPGVLGKRARYRLVMDILLPADRRRQVDEAPDGDDPGVDVLGNSPVASDVNVLSNPPVAQGVSNSPVAQQSNSPVALLGNSGVAYNGSITKQEDNVIYVATESGAEPAATKPKRAKRSRVEHGDTVDSWEPTKEILRWAMEQIPGIDLRRELPRFRAHWEAKEEKRLNWDATWRNWILSPYPKCMLPAQRPPQVQRRPSGPVNGVWD